MVNKKHAIKGKNNSGRAYEQIKKAKDITLNFNKVVLLYFASKTPDIIIRMQK